MFSKNKIRLSRSLHAQTTPHPEVGRWLKRGFAIFLMVFIVGAYYFSKSNFQKPQNPVQNPEPKQILGEQQKPAEYQTYVIKKGDTLFNLSNKFSISWQTLADINHLQEPYILKIGQKIQIPN